MREGTITFALCILLCVGFITSIQAQIPGRIQYFPIQTEAQAEDEILNDFLGNSCFEVDNFRVRARFGNNPSIGFFSEGNTTLGGGDLNAFGEPVMDSGLVISNAPINDFNFGNSVTGAGGNINLPGEPNLSLIEGFYGGTIGGFPGGGGGDVATFDASFIEFDFIPTDEVVSFTYVFASEEYCDFVGSQFNDKFGIFLAGPGITAADAPFILGSANGPLPAINVAEFEDANGNIENVSINNINHALNPDQYVDNNTVNTVNNDECSSINPANNPFTQLSQFDGWTKPQTVFYDSLEICGTYKVRVVVADGTDRIFGSAVFLQSSSFNAGKQNITPDEIVFQPSGETFTYEQCGDSVAFVNFTRDFVQNGNNDDIDIGIEIPPSNSATWGLDYCTDSQAGFFPGGTITVPVGGFSTAIEVKKDIFDNEGVETILINIDDPCSCTEFTTYELEIIDVPPFIVEPLEGNVACFGSESQVLSVEDPEGGFPSVDRADPPSGFDFTWSDENGVISNEQTATVDISEPGTYTYFLEVSDGCNDIHFDTITYVTTSIPNAFLEGTNFICDESPTTVLDLTLEGGVPYTLSYSIDGVPQTPLLITDPDFEFIVDMPGEYTITNIAGPSCNRDLEGTAIVSNQSFNLNIMPTPTLCADSEDGMLMALVSDGMGTYTYLWSDDNEQDTEMAIGLAPGDYTVTVTDELGCTQELIGTVDAAEEVLVDPNLINGTTCGEPMSGELDALASGGNGTFTYEWFDNGGTPIGSGITIDGLISGDYQVVATDENGCVSEPVAINIPSDENTPDAIAQNASIDCNNEDSGVVIDVLGTSLDPGLDYVWTVNPGGGNIMTQNGVPNATVTEPGSYTLQVINTTNGCSASVNIIVEDVREDPVADPGQPAQITCDVSQLTLGGTNTSTGDNITYEWQIELDDVVGMSTASTQTVEAMAAGTYTLIVTNTDNGCTAIESVQVTEDLIDPTVVIGAPALLTCENDTQQLTSAGSSSMGNFTYTWTTLDGSIISDPSGQDITVDDPGTYLLTIINNDNGCEDSDMVEVSEDAEFPEVVIAEPNNIDCIDTQATLDGSGSDSGTGIIYTWTNEQGDVVGSNAILMVTEPGEYTLEVNNTLTGCIESARETVMDIREDPIADPGAPGQINCDVTELTLGGPNTSTNGDFSYEWQIDLTAGGTSTENTQTITATQGGTYILLVTNNLNGCTAMESIFIDEDTTEPTVAIGTPATLTCENDTQQLVSNGSSTGANFTYIWTTDVGSITTDPSLPNITIDDPGNYTLTIINNDTGCESFDVVNVIEDAIFPIVSIAQPGDIDCENTSVVLDGSGSDSGAGIIFTWTNDQGMEIGNGVSIDVDTEGEYTLTVNNTNTGCVETERQIVTDIREDPVADVGPVQLLNCDVTEISLGGLNISTGTEFTYQWTQTGTTFSSTDPNPTITDGGEYILVVTNTTNMCVATETITIERNAEDPEINTDVSGVITCEEPTQTLLTDGSSSGDDFEYSWTGPMGFTSNEENPEITQSGEYLLVITNTVNQCSVSEPVMVEVDADFPAIDIEEPGIVNCANMIIELSGLGSEEGPDIEYLWVASNGGVIDDDEDTLEPEISAAGTYTLIVSNVASGCTSMREVVVTDDFEDPIAMVNENLTFGCQDDILDISGAGSSTGANFVYEWSPTQGNISGPTDQIDTQIDQPGEYTLLVTNTLNGCTADASFVVTPDEDLPVIAIVEPATITCDVSMVSIDASGSDAGADLTYTWTRDGDEFNPPNETSFEVSEPGEYTLTIEDTTNGCISNGTITVEETVEPPTAIAGESMTLNCRDLMLNLDADGSSAGDDFAYSWVAVDGGNIVIGNDTDEPLVDEPGTYILTVTNTLTGCTNTDEVTVIREDREPVIEVQEVNTLNCRDMTITIDANNSDQGADFEISWDAVGTANIVQGEDGLTPEVDEPGTYILTILDTRNFCERMVEITVEQSIEDPMAEIVQPDMLTCDDLVVSLVGSAGSSLGGEFSYTWTSLTPGGSIVGANDVIDIEVDQPGTYELLVTNTENFCETPFSILVEQNIEEPIAVTGGNQEVTCSNTEATLSGIGSSTGPEFEYTWIPLGQGSIVSGGNTLTPTVNAPGEYELVVRNTENGCVNTNIQTVISNDQFPTDTPPTPLLLTCSLTEQTLAGTGNPGLSYEWTTADGSIVGATTNSEITINAPGLYIMTVTSLDNGCSTPFQILVEQDIEDPEVEAGPESTLTCTETVVALLGEGSEGANFRYEWTTNDGIISGTTDELEAFATAGGTYTLTVFNTNNDCVASDDVMISVDEDVPMGIDVDAIPPNCFGDPGAIEFIGVQGGVGPYDYSIDGGETFTSQTLFSNLPPGQTYSLLISDSNGCTVPSEITIPTVDSLSVQVAEPMVEIELGESFDISAFISIPVDEIVSITWSPATGLSCTDCLNPQASPGNSINYNVVVVSENGCIDEADIQFRVDRNIDIYIPNAFSPNNGDGINDLFAPFGKPSLVANVQQFQIFDRWGTQVFQDQNFELNTVGRGWNGQFRNERLQPGVFVYYIVLEFVDGSTELYEGDVTLME